MSTMDSTLEKESKTREVVVDPDWCAGCGGFGVLRSLKKATSDKELKPH
ncbi:MAG: 2-oxoacid ferredoxin oxidoreductase, partial [Bacteroidetes bacterium]|nr:2-oxoacid ferredoxin oxidoreductase [Bacteroidota bacterium]